jgi:hypothetical protein
VPAEPVRLRRGGDLAGPGTRRRTLLAGTVLERNLDVDGDGIAESVTHDAHGVTTVWFSAGTHPVKLNGAGTFVPLAPGQVWLVADGDAGSGFVRSTAHVVRATPAGVVVQPGLVEQMWRDTRAARCPPAAPLPQISVAPPVSTAACPGPPPSVAAQLTAGLVAIVTERAHDLGKVIAHSDIEHTPDLLSVGWSCSRKFPLAVVSYCLRGDEGHCNSGETGLLHHELWARRAGNMVMLERVVSTTEPMEWNVHSLTWIAATPDLDGDGDPDAVIVDSSHEDGAMNSQQSYRAFVGGGFVKIASDACSEVCSDVAVVRAVAGSHDVVVISATKRSDGTATPARAYALVGGHMRVLTGDAEHAALAAAARTKATNH